MIKYPPKLYVVTQKQADYNTNAPLGFLHAYEPGKAAFEKKRETQINWAYNSLGIHDFKLEERTPDYFITGFKWERDPSSVSYNSIKVPFRELITNPPMVWDNLPQVGFKVMKSVSRYSTSNKLWRILDPRNVEFEITTDVMEEVINDATIRNGVIENECVWSKNKVLTVIK